MAAIKTKEQRELLKNHISKLYLQGFSFRGMETWIASNTGLTLTRKMCSIYVNELLEEWQQERVSDIDKLIAAELKGLNDVEREAWDAWEKSKQDRTKSVTRKKGTPNNKKDGDGVTTTSYEYYDEVITGYGDSKFLDIIKECKIQRLQYLTKGSFGKDGDTFNFTQQIVQIGVVERQPPPQAIDVVAE